VPVPLASLTATVYAPFTFAGVSRRAATPLDLNPSEKPSGAQCAGVNPAPPDSLEICTVILSPGFAAMVQVSVRRRRDGPAFGQPFVSAPWARPVNGMSAARQSPKRSQGRPSGETGAGIDESGLVRRNDFGFYGDSPPPLRRSFMMLICPPIEVLFALSVSLPVEMRRQQLAPHHRHVFYREPCKWNLTGPLRQAICWLIWVGDASRHYHHIESGCKISEDPTLSLSPSDGRGLAFRPGEGNTCVTSSWRRRRSCACVGRILVLVSR